MARQITPSQQKLAEKLTILNDRGIGMLTRIYNIKKMLGSVESKPSFLSDKALEPVIKAIVRKFPTVDTKSGSAQVTAIRTDIIKSLSLYYYTFVDIMVFKDHVTNLLTTIDACQVYFDITVNFDLTKGYLDLIVTYVSVLVLLSRVEDRKAVLGLFNFAHELMHSKAEESFPRLGQMIIEYEPPIKKLAEEFIPHSKCLMRALMSLQQIYPRRALTAEEWRSAQMLSLLADSTRIMSPAQIDTLGEVNPHAMWRQALSSNYVLALCRDEVIHIHLFIISYFETIKGYSKRVAEMKEWYIQAVQQAQIPELMFHVEELRALVKKYNQVMQRYFVQYLSGYDAVVLNQLIQGLSVCPEDESVILTSFYNSIASLSIKQGLSHPIGCLPSDTAYTSVSRASLQLKEHRDIAKHMNTVVFHTKMVDFLDEILVETSDLSIYCFYTSVFEHQFKQCMEFPAQHRYSIAFPMVCAHFMQATHQLCPEERHSIGTTSVQYAHWFLKEMSEEVNQVITAICEEQCMLADKILPKNCAIYIAHSINRKKNKDRKNKVLQEPERPGAESLRKHREEFTRMDKLHMALTELCYAINYCSVITVWEHGFVPREFFTQHLEARFQQYTGLFLQLHTDAHRFTGYNQFLKALVGMMMYNPEANEIAKPSELLNSVRAIMTVLQSVENYIHIDISRVFNNVLPQQTQPHDSYSGEKTITCNYTEWYLEVLLRKVSAGHIVYSPNHKAFVSLSSEAQLPFNAEEYASLMELRALAELVGPYGMRYMSERLMWHIYSQVEELKVEELKVEELKRMTIIGVLLSFRSLAQEALLDVLELRIPFLLSSVKDFQKHIPEQFTT
ncbi:hypothetical protein NP493_13g01015 [Ridgeia piscesae]|uniref:Nck-associated protein 1 n=1 Tax=Ridgeia piscesae TaxID=27915 RepID=A0AAD9UL43_RIDPI|nr:hypothetical protein NP493_13g01015 [Ridgeia piscesae]